jgi:hypothetical protein
MKFTNYIKLKENQAAQAPAAGQTPAPAPAGKPVAGQQGQPQAQKQPTGNNQAQTGQQQGQTAQQLDPKAQQAVQAATNAAKQEIETLGGNLSILNKAKLLNPQIAATFKKLSELIKGTGK